MKDITSHITETGDGYDQTKAGLIRKRAALVAGLQAHQRAMAELTSSLRALETTMRLFDPDIDLQGLPASRIPPAYAAFRGEMARLCLSLLRGAEDGLTTHDINVAIMVDRCMDQNDPRARRLIHKRTQHALLKLRVQGHVRSEKADPSGMLRWRMLVQPFGV